MGIRGRGSYLGGGAGRGLYDNKLTTFWFISEYLTAAQEVTLASIMATYNDDCTSGGRGL